MGRRAGLLLRDARSRQDEHCAETKSQRPDLFQPVSVSHASLDRTVFNKIKHRINPKRFAAKFPRLREL
jgi:hypothetical protein